MGELYITWEYWITFAQLMMAMLAMGATLAVHDFVAVVRLPRSFLTGLIAQMVVVPAVAWVLLSATDLDPGVAIGLAILASVPGGTISNVITYAGRGDVPLSIAITAVTSLACVVTVPVVLGLLAGDQVAAGVELPRARIAAEIVVTLLVPLGIGMAVLRRAPEVAARLSRVALVLTTVLIATIVVGSAAAGRLDVEAMGVGNLAVVAGFALALVAIGLGAGIVARRPRPDILAIAIEITVRNTNLGLLVRASVFTAAGTTGSAAADLALFTILAYAAISLALAVPLVAWGRRVVGAGSRPAYGLSEPTTHMAKNCEPPP